MQLAGQTRKSSSPFCCCQIDTLSVSQIISVRMGWLLCVILKSVLFLFALVFFFFFPGGGFSFILRDKGMCLNPIPLVRVFKKYLYPTRSLENYFFFFFFKSSCQLLCFPVLAFSGGSSLD